MQSDGSQKVLSAPVSGASGPHQHVDLTASHRDASMKAGTVSPFNNICINKV